MANTPTLFAQQASEARRRDNIRQFIMHSKHNPIITDMMIRYRVVTQMTSTAYFDFCVLGKLTKNKQPILSNSYRNLKVTAFYQLRHLVTPLKYLLPFQQIKATFQIFSFLLIFLTTLLYIIESFLMYKCPNS